MIELGAGFPERPNFLLSLLDDQGMKSFVGDWETIACHMLQRVYHEHLAGPFRDQPNRLLEQALTTPGVPPGWKTHVVEHLEYPAIPFTLNLGDRQLRIFSTIASIGTPLDITAQNLRIEHYFPMDEPRKAYWQGLGNAGLVVGKLWNPAGLQRYAYGWSAIADLGRSSAGLL